MKKLSRTKTIITITAVAVLAVVGLSACSTQPSSQQAAQATTEAYAQKADNC